MKIQIGGLSDGIHEYHFDARAVDIGLGEEFSDVHADVSLDKAGSQMYMRTKVRSTGAFACDRCTASFTRDLAPAYEMHYVWEGADTSQFDPAEVQVIPSGVSVIDIAEDVRQTVEVAVPLKLLCREECKGLCPICGKNWNEGSCTCTRTIMDSRWEKLAALKNNTTQDSR